MIVVASPNREICEANARRVLSAQGFVEGVDGIFRKEKAQAEVLRTDPVYEIFRAYGRPHKPERECFQIRYAFR